MEKSNVKFVVGNAASITQRIKPYEGEVYYATDTKRCYMWRNDAWICLGSMDGRVNISSRHTNCINCGAVLHSCRCEYCGTEYFGLRRTNNERF